MKNLRHYVALCACLLAFSGHAQTPTVPKLTPVERLIPDLQTPSQLSESEAYQVLVFNLGVEPFDALRLIRNSENPRGLFQYINQLLANLPGQGDE